MACAIIWWPKQMPTSGTFAFNPDNADLVIEAFERCGKRPNQLDAAMLQSAVMSANLLLVDWANKGVNLWAVDLINIPLTAGNATYPIAADTVSLLQGYIDTVRTSLMTTVIPGIRAAIPDVQLGVGQFDVCPQSNYSRSTCVGLEQTQMLATIFDGISRHNPEGLWFRRYAQTHGFKAAIEWRDSGRPIPEGDEARAEIRRMEEGG